MSNAPRHAKRQRKQPVAAASSPSSKSLIHATTWRDLVYQANATQTQKRLDALPEIATHDNRCVRALIRARTKNPTTDIEYSDKTQTKAQETLAAIPRHLLEYPQVAKRPTNIHAYMQRIVWSLSILNIHALGALYIRKGQINTWASTVLLPQQRDEVFSEIQNSATRDYTLDLDDIYYYARGIVAPETRFPAILMPYVATLTNIVQLLNQHQYYVMFALMDPNARRIYSLGNYVFMEAMQTPCMDHVEEEYLQSCFSDPEMSFTAINSLLF